MLEIKALIVILCLTLPVFWIARAPACEFATDRADFNRRRNLWIALTILAFTAHNFWIYIAGAAVVLAIAGRREANPLALFLALLMAVPAFSDTIPGFGGIRHIISLSHVRVLSIVVLLPAYLALRRRPDVLPFGRTAADKFVLGYLGLQLMLQIPVVSLTAGARLAIYSFIDVFLPYYVASRGLRDVRAFADALMAFVLAIVLMAPIALFEYLRHWLLYSGLAASMGVFSKMGGYMIRGDSLRAMASSEHSIVLGYLATIGLALLLFVRHYITSRVVFGLALTLLVGALVASGARGPWVGGIVVLVVVLLTGPDKFKRFFRVSLLAAPVLVALSFTSFGRGLFELLPFVGSADTDSIDYRRRLFDTSVQIILQNPWFGGFDYLVNPSMQDMIQGEGIIDVVNSFLGVALTFGIVGLSLFGGVFLFAGWGVWSTLRRVEPRSDLGLLGRALLAALVSVMLMIVTLSSIGVVPWVYWLLAGLCVGYARLAPEPQVEVVLGSAGRTRGYV